VMRTEGWRFGWGILGCNRGINGVGESDLELTVGADVGSGANAAATLQCFSRPHGTGPALAPRSQTAASSKAWLCPLTADLTARCLWGDTGNHQISIYLEVS